MARIRTVKPDFFRHELLQDLEITHAGKCPMLVFSGLWCIADREGRFEWRPRKIKLDVLPFLPFDMEETMDILVKAELVEKYEHEGQAYGAITAWERHQIPGRDEPPSEIPAPNGSKTPYFRPLSQTQRLTVYERDGWRCRYCSRDLSNDRRAACLDHVFPYSAGGTNRAANLATACKPCNARKADRTPDEAGMPWPDGLGEYLDRASNSIRQRPVNRRLKGRAVVPDKEGEGEGERERKGNGVTAHAPDASRRPPASNGRRISFNFEAGSFEGITEQDELRWQEAYPAVPIPPAIQQAAAWLRANPANRKSNYERFLVAWFKRDQDKAGRVRH